MRSLRGALTELHSSHKRLRGDFEGLEKKSSRTGRRQSAGLTGDVTAAQQSTQDMEGDRDQADRRNRRKLWANLEKRDWAKRRRARQVRSDEKRFLLERADTADKRIIKIKKVR